MHESEIPDFGVVFTCCIKFELFKEMKKQPTLPAFYETPSFNCLLENPSLVVSLPQHEISCYLPAAAIAAKHISHCKPQFLKASENSGFFHSYQLFVIVTANIFFRFIVVLWGKT